MLENASRLKEGSDALGRRIRPPDRKGKERGTRERRDKYLRIGEDDQFLGKASLQGKQRPFPIDNWRIRE